MLKSYFKPYTLRDYQNKFSKVEDKFNKLGGLGPNMDDRWQNAISSLQKIKLFAFSVRQKNEQHSSQKLFKLPYKTNSESSKKISNSRFKALEFAKNIKRPKVTSSPERVTNKELEEDLKRDSMDDRLPLYKKNLKFEEERIKMFYK